MPCVTPRLTVVRPRGHVVADDCERLTEKAYSLRFYGDANADGMVDHSGTEPGDSQWQCHYRMDYALSTATSCPHTCKEYFTSHGRARQNMGLRTKKCHVFRSHYYWQF